MRQWARAAVVALATATAVAASAHAQTFTPARDELIAARVVTMEAAEDWAVEFLALNPSVAAFERVGPGHLVAAGAGGAEVDVYLDGLVDRLSAPGARRALVLADYEASLYEALASAAAPEPIPENVMPIVRHRDFLASVREQAGAPGGADAPIQRALAGDAVALLAYDTPSSIAVMSREALGLEDLSDADAFALATANLARRAQALTWREEGGLRIAVLDGSYESSLLLLDRVWSALEADLGGPLAVAVPARDLLVVGRADRAEDVAALRALIADAMFDPYAVSEEVFVRRAGRWEVLAAE